MTSYKLFIQEEGKPIVVQNLTATENRILQLISEQKNSKEIAALLFVSEKTIRNHRYNIKKKLDLPKENNSLLKWALTYLQQN
jgi:DNA-binding CsgD family transcriptional regulator